MHVWGSESKLWEHGQTEGLRFSAGVTGSLRGLPLFAGREQGPSGGRADIHLCWSGAASVPSSVSLVMLRNRKWSF